MSGERLHYGIERQRHEGFVGREALLARLDELLTAADADRWVVVTGGPGMGKSALLAAWLLRREAAGAAVPHHFIRRGQYDWDDPAKLVGSLIAQLEERYPDQREQDADARIHPAARLAAMLERVSDRALTPRDERLVILIDGLDEYDPPAGAPGADPLAAFLPHVLPRGVSFLCASRPKHPYVEMLAARDGELVQIDLDEADLAADNEATVRAFWERAAPSLGLDARFVAAAVERAGGNLQHAATLRKHLAGLPPERRRVEDIPRGLAALLERTWQRIATEPAAVRGLGLLCAAREALTLDELGAVADWTDEAPRQAFLRGARELLIEARRSDGQEEYRLHHDSIRAHIAKVIGASTLRGHHAALAQRLATWPAPAEAAPRRYALRHALVHRVEAGDWAGAWRLAADTSFLEAKNRELGAHELEADVAHAAERCRASGDEPLRGRFDDLARALGRESHWLRAAPEATAALMWNRLRRLGWSADEIDEQLQTPARARFLRVRHVASRESPALVRELVGHLDSVIACAVTPDGLHVVSASADRTLKVWDLASGRELSTLHGHAVRVSGCAVTADGLRVISASADKTLKVWDLASGRELSTLQGHADRVIACAVTPDGRRVVSASLDRTLKIWDLVTGECLLTHHADTGYSAVAATETAIIAGDAAGAVWFLDWPPSERRERAVLGSPGSDPQPRSDSNHAPNPPRPPMQPTQKHTILFLAANPIETAPLALDREAHAIHKELERSGFRERFELVTRWAVEPLDLLRELVKLKPTVVHFSGHGGQLAGGQLAGGQLQPGPAQSPRRDLAGALDDPPGERRHGLFFQGEGGRARFVSAQALEETFGAAGSSVKLVVLSACYSDVQAAALLAHVDCVIGMSGAILDAAARSFAIGLYGGLGGCESVAAAYKQGRAAISLDGLPDSVLPQLKVRAGVDASRLVLAMDPR